MSVNGSWFFFGFINSSAEVSATSFICFSQFIRANHSSYLFESVYAFDSQTDRHFDSVTKRNNFRSFVTRSMETNK